MDIEKNRLSPEDFLEIAKQEVQPSKGRLTIYLGYAPGVGKTYTMLQDVLLRIQENVDVVVGYVETHNRPETEKLLKDLEIIEPLIVEYKGVKLKEMDLDGIIKRKPQLVVIDELAHSNPPEFRNAKRFQDVEEVLNVGIDVYTAVNVQHLESLNDLIFQITSVRVRETVPDTFFGQAYEIKLVDITPEELVKRLREGKVYVRDMAQIAIERFFRIENLMALRQIALRIAADRVDNRMKQYIKHHLISQPWAIKDKILVGIFASPYAESLVRATYRFASEIDAQWIGLHVESERNENFSEQEKKWLNKALELVQNLGGQVVWVKGEDVADEIIQYARSHGITKIVIGKPKKFGTFSPTIPERLIKETKNVDIYLLDIDNENIEAVLPKKKKINLRKVNDYFLSIFSIASATFVGSLLEPSVSRTTLIVIYFLALVINALFLSLKTVLFSIAISVLAYDFFFLDPRNALTLNDVDALVPFITYLVAAAIISISVSKVKRKFSILRFRQEREDLLYELSTSLIASYTKEQVFSIVTEYFRRIFNCDVAIFIIRTEGGLELAAKTETFAVTAEIKGIAEWSVKNRKSAGLGTDTFFKSPYHFSPLVTKSSIYGVIVLKFGRSSTIGVEDKTLLNSMVYLTALTLERIFAFQAAYLNSFDFSG